jgi:hypothetical protein
MRLLTNRSDLSAATPIPMRHQLRIVRALRGCCVSSGAKPSSRLVATNLGRWILRRQD